MNTTWNLVSVGELTAAKRRHRRKKYGRRVLRSTDGTMNGSLQRSSQVEDSESEAFDYEVPALEEGTAFCTTVEGNVVIENNQILLYDSRDETQKWVPLIPRLQSKCPENTTSDNNQAVAVWCTRRQSVADQDATLLLISLRRERSSKFDDKKTTKNVLWAEIADMLNGNGFFVGHGVEGREKCRVKFANLQSAYVTYLDKRKRTGEGFVKPCAYYEELHQIFGQKDKIHPPLVVDSLDDTSPDYMAERICMDEPTTFRMEKPHSSYDKPPSSLGKAPSSLGKPPSHGPKPYDATHSGRHRFQDIKKSVRPKSERQTVLEKLLAAQEESREQRKKEFETMTNIIQKEAQNRHEQLMALISSMKKK